MQLIHDEGYAHKPRTPEEGAAMLADIVKEGKEEGLMKIAEIHPDRDLLLGKTSPGIDFPTSQSMLKAEGDPESNKLSENTMNLMIIAGSAVLGITLITLIVTAK